MSLVAEQSLTPPIDDCGQHYRPLGGNVSRKIVDKVTGLPLPFAPRYDLPAVGESTINGVVVANDHHPTHPREDFEHGTEAQQAMRHCRVQWVGVKEHW